MLPGGAHGKRKSIRLSSASSARVDLHASLSLAGFAKRTLTKLRPRTTVSGLRVVWLLAVAWYELGIFHWSVAKCRWPDSVLQGPNAAKAHVLLVADPQILDMHSYPDRGFFLSALSQLIVDLNLRKSWRAIRTWLLSQSETAVTQDEADAKEAVVFLGDMMDSGRSAYTDEEYQQYFQRFKSIFATKPSTRVYYIPGNHDVGLGASHKFSPEAKARYVKHFGELNYWISMANHSLVMIDAPGLVEEDYRRANAKTRFEDWTPKAGSPIDFVQKYASVGDEIPTILFTHIPLHRPEKAGCGPLREKGSIRRGVGFGYQNTLGRITSQFLLKSIRPIGVFSGDDHDYCEYIHSIPLLSESPNPEIFSVREVTVKSLSMAMGIQQPGFQLLSLIDPHSIPADAPSAADEMCLLPDQLSIYLVRYLPLLLMTLLALAISTLRKYQVLSHRHTFGSADASGLGTGVAASPESSYRTDPLSTARMPSASSVSRSGRSAAPHLRASSASLAPPQTPDTYAFESMTPPHSAGRAPSGLLSTPLSGTTFEELENGADEGVMVNQMSRYRRTSYFGVGEAEEDESEGISIPFIGRIPWNRNRRRWMAWTWTFVFRGRRSRLTIGIPPLLEQVIITLVSKMGWGRLSGRRGEDEEVRLSRKGYAGGPTNPASIFARDFLSAAFLPITLFVLINWYVLRS